VLLVCVSLQVHYACSSEHDHCGIGVYAFESITHVLQSMNIVLLMCGIGVLLMCGIGVLLVCGIGVLLMCGIGVLLMCGIGVLLVLVCGIGVLLMCGIGVCVCAFKSNT